MNSSITEPFRLTYDVHACSYRLAGGARIQVVADTNVLMSHSAWLRRTFDDMAAAAGGADGSPSVLVSLVVPWVVQTELDALKHKCEGCQRTACCAV